MQKPTLPNKKQDTKKLDKRLWGKVTNQGLSATILNGRENTKATNTPVMLTLAVAYSVHRRRYTNGTVPFVYSVKQ